jgi:hypothetical protein
VPTLSETVVEWFASGLAARIAAKLPVPAPDPAVAAALAEQKEILMAMKDALAALAPKVEQAVAKIVADNTQVAGLTADNAAKDATIADLTAQRDAAVANASDPADETTVAGFTAALDGALNPPAPPATEANPS